MKTRTELETFIEEVLEPAEPQPAVNIREATASGWLLQKKFEQLLAGQTIHLRKALRSCKADTFEGFYQKLIQQQWPLRIFSDRKSSYPVQREIMNFRRRIIREIAQVQKYHAPGSVLAGLDYLFIRDNTFSNIECFILKHYLHYIAGSRHVNQRGIGKLFNITHQRVSQITIRLLNKTDRLLSEYKKELNPDLSYYYTIMEKNNGQEAEQILNRREGTRFGYAFIRYAIEKLSD